MSSASTALFDVAVAGLGATGSATACALAQRGLAVIGFDRHTPPHAFGSSHGDSRIIREAYFEDPVYVPMVQRAYELWRALERSSGTRLLLETSGLMIGAPDSTLVRGARHSAELHGLPYTMLTAAEVGQRFPALQPEDGMVAVWEPRAGVLRPEACVDVQLAGARQHGAELHFDEPIEVWHDDGAAFDIITVAGRYRARHLVLSAGAWIDTLLPRLAHPFTIERQVLQWFEPVRDAALFTPQRCPIHLWQFDGERFFYGFPDTGAGVKLAFHHGGEITRVDRVRRAVDDDDSTSLRAALRRFVPAADGRVLASTVCLYTNTPDEHFRIDRHPQHERVVIASACSGHGFKFAPVLGEIVADMIEQRAPRFDLTPFRWR
jgi:sarcosine oxidase